MFKRMNAGVLTLTLFFGTVFGWSQSATETTWDVSQILTAQASKQAIAKTDLQKTKRKIGIHLQRLVNEHQSFLQNQLAVKAVGRFTTNNPMVRLVGNYVTVDAIADGDADALLADLLSLGLQNAAVYNLHVGGELPLASLPALESLTSLRFARPGGMFTESAGLVCSRGDVVLATDQVRNQLGFDGTGVTVGVISDSYDCLSTAAADVASGDLPTGVQVLSESCPGTDEGRAMLQIVHDLAPGADLAFHSGGGTVASLASAIDNLVNVAGADVVVDDLKNIFEPIYQDGAVSQAVDNAAAAGVAYFSSAGNYERDAYESAFVSSGIQGVFGAGTVRHDFDPGPGVDDLLTITLPTGRTGVTLQWDQPFFSVSGAPGAASDLDLIFYTTGGAVIGQISSFDVNFGGDPVEALSINVGSGPLQLQIGIEHAGGPFPGAFKLIFLNSAVTIDEHQTNSSTVFGHSAAQGAITVGAAAWFNSQPFNPTPFAVVEGFSSAGYSPILFDTAGNAAPDLRLKPDVVATDAVNTTFFGINLTVSGIETDEPDGFPNFFGTSAAAPHAAAVGALLLDANPALTPEDILYLLVSNTQEMDDPDQAGFDAGYDAKTGWGLIDAFGAVQVGATYPGNDQVLDLNFDQTNGPEAYDRSGLENNAELVGGSSFAPGLFGQAIDLDGSTGYLFIEHDPSFLIDEGTVAFWFNARSLWGRQNLVSKDAKNFLDGGHLNIWLDDDDEVIVRIQSDQASIHLDGQADFHVDTWYHVAFTFGPSGVKLYIDGVLVCEHGYTGGLGATSNTTGAPGNQEPLVLGVNSWASDPLSAFPLSGSYFDGHLDEFLILDRALSAAEIVDLANPNP